MVDQAQLIEDRLRESSNVKLLMVRHCIPAISQIARLVVDCYRDGGKLLLVGNGGSAADAQHIAAELVAKLKDKRPPLPAVSLTTNSSTLTAVGNDWSYDDVFARQVEALGRRGDVLIAISTSGESENVLRAVESARNLGVLVAGFAGENKSRLDSMADVCLKIPSNETARIQEGHILAGHIICELVELAVFGGGG